MSNIGTLNPDNDQAPGYCSSISVRRPLDAAQTTRILAANNGGSAPRGMTVFSEKELVGKGTRKLCALQEGGLFSSQWIFVEYAGVRNAKFVSKDADRYEAMVQGAIDLLGESFGDMAVTKVVLLGEEGTICRRNTLTRLHRNGIIVMRCPSETDFAHDDSSSSGISDSDSD